MHVEVEGGSSVAGVRVPLPVAIAKVVAFPSVVRVGAVREAVLPLLVDVDVVWEHPAEIDARASAALTTATDVAATATAVDIVVVVDVATVVVVAAVVVVIAAVVLAVIVVVIVFAVVGVVVVVVVGPTGAWCCRVRNLLLHSRLLNFFQTLSHSSWS